MTTWTHPVSWMAWWKRLLMPWYWPIIGKKTYTWKPPWWRKGREVDPDLIERNRYYDQVIINAALSGPSKKQKELEMKEKETTFENAKVGDDVWSPLFGVGRIVEIESVSEDYPIIVKPYNNPGRRVSFACSGQYLQSGNQLLFWSEVKIEAPVRPKQKVKKMWKGWANVYEDQAHCHPTKAKAKSNAGFSVIAMAVPIEIEYEVEE